MASPQCENGYTKIANEILEQLITQRVPGEQFRVLLCIIRASYGWNEKSVSITHQEIADQTGIVRQNVTRAIKALASKKMLSCIKKDAKGCNDLIFNKNYDEWVNRPKRETCIKKDAETGIKKDADDNITPIILKKRKKPPTPKGGKKKEILNQTQLQLFEIFWSAYPKKKSKGQAKKTWKKLNPDEFLLDRILASIETAKKSKQWLKDDGDFIPHPSTWLNAEGWEDEEYTPPEKITQWVKIS